MNDLFDDVPQPLPQREALTEGAVLLRGRAMAVEAALLAALDNVVSAAPFRHMVTPRGFTMSVAMTGCGDTCWITDRKGYRYSRLDPKSGLPWPAIPDAFTEIAKDAALDAGYADFTPDSCLVNRYIPNAKMALHQDKDEQNFACPIVSVSLGLPATFQFGGLSRKDLVTKYLLTHGDVVVWGGPSRLFYHGVLTLKNGMHEKLGRQRINLTFRRAL